MTIIVTQCNKELWIVNLFKHSSANTAIHIMFAAFLMVMTWGTATPEYAFYWTSVLACTLAISLFYQTRFNHRKAQQTQNATQWENILVCITLVASIIFAAAYYYLATLVSSQLWAMIGLIAAMHMGSATMTCLYSKKIILAMLLPTFSPLVIAFILIAQPISFILAASLTIFAGVVLFFSISVNRSLINGLNMQVKYEDAAQQSEYYKKKVETSTFDDPETGLFNRRLFDLIINEEIRRAKRINSTLSLVMIEVDCLSQYKAQYSQCEVDECTRTVANVLAKATSRGGEFMTRFDKQKFALVIPNANKSDASSFSAKMLDLINKAKIEHLYTNVENFKTLSISIGIAEFIEGSIIDIEEITSQAIIALAESQKNGGHQVRTFDDEMLIEATVPNEVLEHDEMTPSKYNENSQVA
jgi:diguanylate cyclase (GGDEF)-like protein